MYIKVVNLRLTGEVAAGDIVQTGVVISNSETGLGSVYIQPLPLIYRLVCSNGMVVNDAKMRRNRVGRVSTTDDAFLIYSQEILAADDHAFMLKIQDTVRAAVDEARFSRVLNTMRESKGKKLTLANIPNVVKLTSSSFGITEPESEGVFQHLTQDADYTLYGLPNAVTWYSQDVESYDCASKLEELARDMEGLQIGFQRVKIPGGGSTEFEVPGEDPGHPEKVKFLEGVIVDSHNANTRWPEDSEYDDNTLPASLWMESWAMVQRHNSQILPKVYG